MKSLLSDALDASRDDSGGLLFFLEVWRSVVRSGGLEVWRSVVRTGGETVFL